jgi:hypothetical protein
MTGCRPDLLMAGQPGVDQGADGCWMPDRGDTSDRLSGVPAYEIGIGSTNPRRGRGPEQGGVGTVRSAGQDEQRYSVGVEDQGVRDGPDIAAELVPQPRPRSVQDEAASPPDPAFLRRRGPL